METPVFNQENNSVYFEKSEMRDLRRKTRFMVDDIFVDKYAKCLHPYSSLVYLSLCRHVDKSQKCFPGIKKIMEEFGIKKDLVIRGIQQLEMLNIIRVERKPGNVNVYELLDQEFWKIFKNLSKK